MIFIKWFVTAEVVLCQLHLKPRISLITKIQFSAQKKSISSRKEFSPVEDLFSVFGSLESDHILTDAKIIYSNDNRISDISWDNIIYINHFSDNSILNMAQYGGILAIITQDEATITLASCPWTHNTRNKHRLCISQNPIQSTQHSHDFFNKWWKDFFMKKFKFCFILFFFCSVCSQ